MPGPGALPHRHSDVPLILATKGNLCTVLGWGAASTHRSSLTIAPLLRLQKNCQATTSLATVPPYHRGVCPSPDRCYAPYTNPVTVVTCEMVKLDSVPWLAGHTLPARLALCRSSPDHIMGGVAKSRDELIVGLDPERNTVWCASRKSMSSRLAPSMVGTRSRQGPSTAAMRSRQGPSTRIVAGSPARETRWALPQRERL